MSGIIYAVDPGKSSGVAIATYDVTVDEDLFVTDVIQVTYPVNELVECLVKDVRKELEMGLHDTVHVVTERYVVRMGSKFQPDLTPVKFQAALDYALADLANDPRLILSTQLPSQAKALITNDALKRLGYYLTGKDVGQPDADDARDALRHLVYYGVKTLRLKDLGKRLAA